MKSFEYLEPTSVSEACGLLKRHAGEAKVFAGGSGFTILMKQLMILRSCPPKGCETVIAVAHKRILESFGTNRILEYL